MEPVGGEPRRVVAAVGEPVHQHGVGPAPRARGQAFVLDPPVRPRDLQVHEVHGPVRPSDRRIQSQSDASIRIALFRFCGDHLPPELPVRLQPFHDPDGVAELLDVTAFTLMP